MPILAITTQVTEETVTEYSSQWDGFTVTWTGWNGDTWTLTDPESGVVLLNTGLTGVGMPTVTRYTSQAPAVPGARWKGSRIEERELLLPLLVRATGGSTAWLRVDDKFWKTIDPDRPGVLRVTAPSGAWREITCRFSAEDGTFATDPSAVGWCVYALTMVADDNPMWVGPATTRTYTAQDAAGFFSGSGGVISISGSQTLNDAVVSNDGDIPAWPVWTLTGPCDSATVAVGGGQVSYTSPIADGASIIIDTNPVNLSVTDGDGNDVIGAVSWSPLPVPAGGTSTVTVTMAPTGDNSTVTVALTPLYYRAW